MCLLVIKYSKATFVPLDGFEGLLPSSVSYSFQTNEPTNMKYTLQSNITRNIYIL